MRLEDKEVENPFVEGSPAALVYARVSDAVVARLTEKFEAVPPKKEFQKTLRMILQVHEMAEMGNDRPPKKIARRQLQALKAASQRFLSALNNLHPHSLEDLQWSLEESEILEFAEKNPDADFDAELDLKTIGMGDLRSHISEIARWTKGELNKLDQPPSAKSSSTGSNLDGTIVSLAEIFERYGNRVAKSSCYYDGVSNGYKGDFYEFALEFFDLCAPDSYFSAGALGKRITRTLAKDAATKTMP